MATTIVHGFQDPDSASKGLSWIQKDPSDKKDYQINWASFLTGAETISSVTWVVHDNEWAVISSPAAGDLQQPGSPAASNTTTTATVWLSSGTATVRYLVTCRMTSSAGRISDQSFQVRIVQR